jgi:hypothetical protein
MVHFNIDGASDPDGWNVLSLHRTLHSPAVAVDVRVLETFGTTGARQKIEFRESIGFLTLCLRSIFAVAPHCGAVATSPSLISWEFHACVTVALRPWPSMNPIIILCRA